MKLHGGTFPGFYPKRRRSGGVRSQSQSDISTFRGFQNFPAQNPRTTFSVYPNFAVLSVIRLKYWQGSSLLVCVSTPMIQIHDFSIHISISCHSNAFVWACCFRGRVEYQKTVFSQPYPAIENASACKCARVFWLVNQAVVPFDPPNGRMLISKGSTMFFLG